MVGRRRFSPRSKTCMAGSGPKAANTSWRCASVSLSRVSSSWLRRNVAHWQVLAIAGLCRSALTSGTRVLAGQGEVGGLHPDEVELHLQLVGRGAAEEGPLLGMRAG